MNERNAHIYAVLGGDSTDYLVKVGDGGLEEKLLGTERLLDEESYLMNGGGGHYGVCRW